MMLCAIGFHLYNLKNEKNTHGGALLLVKLQALVIITYIIIIMQQNKRLDSAQIEILLAVCRKFKAERNLGNDPGYLRNFRRLWIL